MAVTQTNTVTTNNSGWSLMGSGPMKLQPVEDTAKIWIADTAPSGNIGFVIVPSHETSSIFSTNSTSNVWVQGIYGNGIVVIGPL